MRYTRKVCSFVAVLFVLASVLSAQNNLSASDRTIVANIEKNARDYAEQRARLEGRLPKLPTKATPEQIEAHKAALLKSLRTARTGSKRGAMFTPGASIYIRKLIQTEFKGRDRNDLRKTVFEAETRGVPVRVNAAYPEAVEIIEMPPALLLALPQLPPQIRYRFVGTNLLLVDRESNLIIDYMTRAMP